MFTIYSYHNNKQPKTLLLLLLLLLQPLTNMFSQDYSQLQDFQYFVVIDFEATCDKGKNNLFYPQEIIEFPSVLVNAVTGELQAYFQTYVKPIYHPKLTDFCKELTGIQQVQVDNGISLREALELHDKSLQDMGIKDSKFAVVTWSNWDCEVMLEKECKLKWIEKPDYFNRWIDLRVAFSEVFGSKCKLKQAVEMAGLVWEGRQHCGLDDAINTACLLVQLMKTGYKFSLTNSLTSSSTNQKQFSITNSLMSTQQKQFSITNSLMSTQQKQQKKKHISIINSLVSTHQKQQKKQKQHSPPDYQHYFPIQQQQQLPLDYQHYYMQQQQQCPPEYQVYYPLLHQSLPNHHDADTAAAYLGCKEQLKNGQDCFNRSPVLFISNGTGVYFIDVYN